MRDTFTTDAYATEGVIPGLLNQLAVTGASSPLSVGTGGAYVYGFFYQNTTSASVAVTTPSIGTTGHRIVLRLNWANRQVRITLRSSADGTSSAPALVQTAPTPLTITAATNATPIAITTSTSHGYSTGNSVEISNVLGNTAANGTWTITNTGSTTFTLTSSVGNGAYTSGGTSTLLTNSIWDISLATLTITTGGVITVTDTRDYIHPGKAFLYRRQGGSSTDFSTSGTTNYTPGAVNVQGGAISVSFPSSATSNLATVTFPVAFSGKPLVLLTVFSNGSSTGRKMIATVETISTTQVTIRGSIANGDTTSSSFDVYWCAYGPE